MNSVAPKKEALLKARKMVVNANVNLETNGSLVFRNSSNILLKWNYSKINMFADYELLSR